MFKKKIEINLLFLILEYKAVFFVSFLKQYRDQSYDSSITFFYLPSSLISPIKYLISIILLTFLPIITYKVVVILLKYGILLKLLIIGHYIHFFSANF